MVQYAGVCFGGPACLVDYSAWACVAGPLRGLEADRGDFANFCGVLVGHAVKEEGGVPSVGRFHLVPYGVPIMGPCRTDGPCGYGGRVAPVCCRWLGDRACVWLEGRGVVCQVECLEAYGGVQDPREVVCQALIG